MCIRDRVIIALQPLVVVLIEWAFREKRPNSATMFGICLGVVGIGVLAGQPQFQAGTGPLLAIGALLLAILAWGAATVWIPMADLPESMFERVALQMLSGSVVLLITSALLGEFREFEPDGVTQRGLWSLGYLIVFGSLAAMTAYNYLLVKVEPSKVVTNTYVNPIIAVFLGCWLNKEPFDWTTVVAAGFLLTGVYLIVHNRRQKPASAQQVPASD